MSYKIKNVDKDFEITLKWNGGNWKHANSLQLENYMGTKPVHFPNVYVKLLYSTEYLYVLFKVEDKYVRSIKRNYQGNVFEDSCVEFFFSPSSDISKGYFNLETNCGGVQLFHFNSEDKSMKKLIRYEDYKGISIANSLPKVNDPEIKDSLTWYVGYKITFNLMGKYLSFPQPESGSVWKANFYKCADETSHPHWLTWNKVDYIKPNFHLPQYFGTLIFD